MRDLLIEYIKSSKELKERIESFKLEHKEVLDAYKEGKGKNKGKNQTAACPIMNELTILNSMYNEQLYIIEWIRSGHDPNVHNAIDISGCYLMDQQVLEQVLNDSQYIKVSNDEYNDYINDVNSPISHALRKLSKREREVFIMMDCEKLYSRQVADLLGIKVTSVESYRERAKKKIEKEIQNNLFLML